MGAQTDTDLKNLMEAKKWRRAFETGLSGLTAALTSDFSESGEGNLVYNASLCKNPELGCPQKCFAGPVHGPSNSEHVFCDTTMPFSSKTTL